MRKQRRERITWDGGFRNESILLCLGRPIIPFFFYILYRYNHGLFIKSPFFNVIRQKINILIKKSIFYLYFDFFNRFESVFMVLFSVFLYKNMFGV